MSDSSALPPSCPQCGAALPAEATEGLCPRCLMAQAMQPSPPGAEANPDSEAATIVSSRPRPTLSGSNQPDLPLPEELTEMLPHGNYHVEGFLGAGGMGAVYKGMQVRLKRPVAIKIMRRTLGKDYDFEQRFEREAQAMAKLNHPNIVSVIDYGEAGPDYLYIVMELVDGADMMDVIRGGQMTQEMALSLLPQICDALQFAHDHGIVHRDIKPSNIMLTRDGRIKMADFGLAKRFDTENSFRTQTGTGMGTPDYAAPEQFSPNSPIDHRADIYALGVMIYQMITGQLPRGVWKPPSQRAEVSTQWDAIVSRAMQNDPSDRYQQASEVKTDVTSIPLTGSRVRKDVAEPPPNHALAGVATKSRAPLLIGLVVGAAALTLGAFIFMKEPAPANSEAKAAASTPASARSSPDAQVSRTQVTASAIQWRKAGWTEEDLKKKTIITDGDWVRIGQAAGALEKTWKLAGDGSPISLGDGAVRLRYRFEGRALTLKIRNHTTYGYVTLWPSRLDLGIWSTAYTEREKRVQTRALATPLKDGEEGVLELAADGRRLFARLNGSIVLLSEELPDLGLTGGCEIQSDGVSFRDVEYCHLSGIPDPLKALGWEEPAADPIADVGWSDLMVEWERYPDRVSSLEKESVKKVTEGWRAAADSGVNATLNDPLGRDLAVRVTARFDPINLSSKTDPGFTVRARRTGPGKTPKQYTGCLFRSGKADLRVSDGNSTDWRVLKSFEMPAGFDPRQSHTIEISTQRDLISFHIDGTLIASVRDATLPPGGRFGMTGNEGILLQKAEYRYLDGVSNPASATKDAPFVNSLGMKFVPVPITGGPTDKQRVLFSVWETRVQDYEVFVKETKHAWSKPDVDQGPAHAVAGVSWEDAQTFCFWLTERERKAGKLGANERYRLPSDHEWSCAVGIGDKEDATKPPNEKSGRMVNVLPWGDQWPPPANSGNYWSEELRPLLAAQKYRSITGELPGYKDGQPLVGPGGGYAANGFGIHDLGGNVWEWCEDWLDAAQKERVLRGGSWAVYGRGSMVSSYRNHQTPDSYNNSIGFRCVLSAVSASSVSAVSPPSSANPIQTFAGHRYQLVPGAMTWDEAKTKAESMGGHLATVTSKEKAAWVLTTFASHLAVSTPKLWLGGSAAGSDQPWRWVTGEPFEFTDWAEGEPNYITANGPVAGPYAAAITRNPGGLRWTESPANSGRSTGFLVEWDDAGGAPATTAAGAGEQWVDGLAEWWAKYPNGKFKDGLDLLRREGVGSRTVGTTPIYAGSDLRDAAVRVTALGGGPEWRLCVRAMNGAYEASLQRDGKGNIKLTSQPMKILSSFKLPEKFSFDERHTVELRCLGDELTFILDGTEMARLRDQSKTWGGVSFQPGIGTLIEKLEYAKLLQPKSEQLAGSLANTRLTTSATATKDAPFINTLGMKFVPVPITGGPTNGKRVLFSIWETRVQDYLEFARANKVDGRWQEQQKDGVPVGRELDHPVVGVNWEDAQAFCQWLTAKETAEGKLPPGMKYRLPSDEEWSWAVGLPPEPGATPAEKSGKNGADFPWGIGSLLTGKEANYVDDAFHAKFPKQKAGNGEAKKHHEAKDWFVGYDDGYATTSPVGSFPANAYGLYDMGGNVWQWCEDWFDKDQNERVLRGGSWACGGRLTLLSSYRKNSEPGTRGFDNGFRCVLAATVDTASASPSLPGSKSSTSTATKDAPFTNTLGMKLVPVPGTKVLFCIHEARYQDYAAYAAETPGIDNTWKDQSVRGFVSTENREQHPVMKIGWEDAQKFCAWLSRKEGKTYRLPTDEEWSFAVGLGSAERQRPLDATPAMLSQKENTLFPWGGDFPPKTADKAGNYSDASRKARAPDDTAKYLEGYDDGYPTTAPVMSFKPNELGLYDMGGNVWEWCEDSYDATQEQRVLRGGNWNDATPDVLLSSSRWHATPSHRANGFGFRIVLEISDQTPTPVNSPDTAHATPTATVEEASIEHPYVNTLGMKFVPVPITGGPMDGKRVLFSVWETRVQDYETFVKETKREWPKPDFEQGPTHPAVMVS